MRTAVIATTYNQPADLDLYLHSLRAQSDDEFNIYIADDGSRSETKDVVTHHQVEFFGERLQHVWHEDVGYRKSKIVNLAVRASSEEWLIFTDSDLFVHPHFIADHRSMAKSNALFMGRRVDLNSEVSNKIRARGRPLFDASFYLDLLKSQFSTSPIKNLNRAIRVPYMRIAEKLGMDRVPDLLGSNFSIHRDLLLKVNGFNEALEHYWGEDGDLFVRARNAGAEISGRKSFALQFHLWHTFRQPKPDAEQWYAKLLKTSDYVRCEKGLQ